MEGNQMKMREVLEKLIEIIEPKLKPCPFCGGVAKYVTNTPRKDGPIEMLFRKAYRVECGRAGCWNSGPLPNNWWGDKKTAAKVWNRRTDDAD